MRKRVAISLSAGGFVILMGAAPFAVTGVAAPQIIQDVGSHHGSGLAGGVRPAPSLDGLDTLDTSGATAPAASAPSPSSSPSSSSSSGSPSPVPRPSVSTASGSIAYLAQRYGVSQAEAKRRLELQQNSTVIADSLAQRFPDEFGGVWLDHAAGGVLKVNMTDPGKLAGVSEVKAVKAKWSLRQLRRAAGDVAAALGADDVATVVDPVSNQVVVRVGSRLSINDPGLAVAVNATNGAARLDTAVAAQPFEFKSCDPLRCGQPPLRAGIRLDIPRDDATVGGCSVGLRLRSNVSGETFVLTAGHCVLSPTHTRVDDAWHQYLGPRYPVTVESSDTRLAENDPSTGRDYAVMPYHPDAHTWLSGDIRGWAGYPNVINYPGRKDLPITGFIPFNSVVVGSVVCASGSGYTPQPGEPIVDSGAGAGYVPGIHCGEITSKGSMINVNICARRGDSGGPLFTETDGKVLGILSGGDPRQGACVAGDTETNSYAPISTILDRVNSRTNNAYAFALAPSDTTTRRWPPSLR